MFNPEDDEDDEYEALYENGHWEWSNVTNSLIFISHEVESEEEFDLPVPAVFGPVEFRDDLDLFDQQRFRKRYQRKISGSNDVVFLQDVKDVVLFTAPINILSAPVIKVLHLATTDRFIRALILYCQYYLQIAEEMSHRMIQLETKVRTPKSIEVETKFRNNMEDLRILVAKEYCTMIMGGHDFKNFHHMGTNKKSRSLSKTEACLFESVLRLCIQIIWLALGRKGFHQIELEVHRIFKSQAYNIIEHKLNTNYVSNMSPQEHSVLLGHCMQHMTKLTMQSPLMNDVLCNRPIDFRLLGLGSIKFAKLTSSQRFFEELLSASENTFQQKGLTLGIIGMTRSKFDSMLRKQKGVTSTSSSFASDRVRSQSRTSRSSRASRTSRASRASRCCVRKSTMDAIDSKLYCDIVLPESDTTFDKEWRPDDFPSLTFPTLPYNKKQRDLWLARVARLTSKRLNSAKKKRK